MKNFVQDGDAVYVPAPTGGVASGHLVVIGSLVGVAGFDAAAGEIVPLHIGGIFSLPKRAVEAWSPGAAIYWDATDGYATAASTAIKIGVATPLAPDYASAAGNGASVGDVRINISF